MTQKADIFEKHKKDYMTRISGIDLNSRKDVLGLEQKSDLIYLPFFGQNYLISKKGITDNSGNEPGYGVHVILSKYILLCPDKIHQDMEWVTLKDFKRTSHFLNLNYFTSDTEKVITSTFSENIDILFSISQKLGGTPDSTELPYDLNMRFDMLPRISLLLLFNEKDEDFPCHGTVLFQKHAEYYLDPESLAVTSAFLASRLKKAFDSIS